MKRLFALLALSGLLLAGCANESVNEVGVTPDDDETTAGYRGDMTTDDVDVDSTVEGTGETTTPIIPPAGETTIPPAGETTPPPVLNDPVGQSDVDGGAAQSGDPQSGQDLGNTPPANTGTVEEDNQ